MEIQNSLRSEDARAASSGAVRAGDTVHMRSYDPVEAVSLERARAFGSCLRVRTLPAARIPAYRVTSVFLVRVQIGHL